MSKENLNAALADTRQKWNQLKERMNEKLISAKLKVAVVTDQLAARFTDALAKEVAKWAPVGEQLEQFKTTAKTEMTQKVEDDIKGAKKAAEISPTANSTRSAVWTSASSIDENH